MLKNKVRKFYKRNKAAFVIILLAIFIFVSVLGLLLSSGIEKVDPVESYDGDNKFITFDNRTLIAAHRGGSGIAPENTLYALENCLSSPHFRADILEFDLYLTSDEKLVLLYDETFDRTSNAREVFGHKNVYPHDKTYGQLRELNLGENFEDPEGNFPYRGLRGEDIPAGLRVTSLVEVLEVLRSEPYRNYNFQYIIQIRDSDDLGRRAMDLLYKYMVQFDIIDKAVIGSINQCVIDHIDNNYNDITRSASMKEVMDFYFSSIFNVDISQKDYKFKVLQIPYKQFGINFGKKSIVDFAHHYGLAVQFWTINN
ncbi:MAG: glycerophosphodiester phosphodiesterase family protein, partial [Bacillota bacterium]